MLLLDVVDEKLHGVVYHGGRGCVLSHQYGGLTRIERGSVELRRTKKRRLFRRFIWIFLVFFFKSVLSRYIWFVSVNNLFAQPLSPIVFFTILNARRPVTSRPHEQIISKRDLNTFCNRAVLYNIVWLNEKLHWRRKRQNENTDLDQVIRMLLKVYFVPVYSRQ